MRILSKAFLFSVAICFCIQHTTAQKPTNKKPVAAIQKFKPPKLYTYIGTYKDSVSIPVEAAENVIAQPLKIYDDKKVEYTVSSYQFLYRKVTVTEDEQSGKVSPASSVVAQRFTSTPLSALWLDQVREQLKPGEELYFFDVIAKDSQGRVMYANNLKIMTR
jgi:hypothetical protein